MGNLIARGFAVAALALLSASPTLAQSTRPESRLVGVVNVNTATSEQLELLPGVGPARAVSIIEHRKEHGPFGTPSDLTSVSGIGDKALERMRAHVSTKGKTTAELKQP